MFKARAGRDLNDQTSRQFSALTVLAEAIDRAGSADPRKIRDSLAAIDIPGDRTIMPGARVKFDATGQDTFASPVLIRGAGAFCHRLSVRGGDRQAGVADEFRLRRP